MSTHRHGAPSGKSTRKRARKSAVHRGKGKRATPTKRAARPRKRRVRRYSGAEALRRAFAPVTTGGESLFDLEATFHDEKAAERYFINHRWPDGVHCPECGSVKVYDSKLKSRRLTRFKCFDCGKQFTVTSGTVMDGTKLPLGKWMKAYHRIGGSKKGVPARQLARELGIGLRSAWHLGHRVRKSMTENKQLFDHGTVEADETYIGGKRKGRGRGYKGNKIAVLGIVERAHGIGKGKGKRKSAECTNECPGRVQTIALPQGQNVDGRSVAPSLRKHTDPATTRLMTDESPIYDKLGEDFRSHESVNHSKKEYARIDPLTGRLISTNAAEGMFANLKRQITGTHHSVSQKHLPRYLEEHDHRYNHRDMTDTKITEAAIGRMEIGPVRLFKPKGGKASEKQPDSLIGYAYDEHPLHGTMRGMHARLAKRKRESGEGGK